MPAGGLRVRVLGMDVVRSNLRAMGRALQQAVNRWAYSAGNEIMARSARRVPVDTGALKGSAHVEPPRVRRGVTYVEIGYGSVAVDYAWKVHEDLGAFHTVGEAKFLENSLVEFEPLAEPSLRREIARELGG